MQYTLFCTTDSDAAIGMLPVWSKLRLYNKGQDQITGHLVPGGYKYGNLALQVGEVSDETLKYCYGFCATRTIE
jgi:hypothetical protein